MNSSLETRGICYIRPCVKSMIEGFILPSMTNLLQPADVGWMEKTTKREELGIISEEKTTKRFGNIRSPGFTLGVTWIGEIREQFPRERIIASFNNCGITGTRQPHELLSIHQSK